LEKAQAKAAHESPRTTKLYDRTGEKSPSTRSNGSRPLNVKVRSPYVSEKAPSGMFDHVGARAILPTLESRRSAQARRMTPSRSEVVVCMIYSMNIACYDLRTNLPRSGITAVPAFNVFNIPAIGAATRVGRRAHLQRSTRQG
jgi:hypothetical protein